MSKKQDMFYFESFIACAEDACSAARLLKETLANFEPQKLRTQLEKLHDIEHEADKKKHAVTDKLSKAFITPIEREDIASLCQNVDEVTDKLEDVAIRLYLNNVQEIRPEALDIIDVVQKCCNKMVEMLKEFPEFRRSKKLKELVIQINDLEEEADRLFISAMRKLHTESKDALHIIAWREIFTYLEKCADACEHVADVVESVVMKNS